jgi:D-alanine-D-alanine ligase
MSKLRVGILFGGQSSEHEVSLLSARSVVTALDTTKYEPVLIGIDTHGLWHRLQSMDQLLQTSDASLISLPTQMPAVAMQSWPLISTSLNVDVIFPVLHGPMGEDGTIQGLLTLANLPYVGSGVLGSAIGMDKDVMKRLLREAGLPVGDFVAVHRFEMSNFDSDQIVKRLGMPLFVKPANAGSSVGVTKVRSKEELWSAIQIAIKYDSKVLIEAAIGGQEVECAVLGNNQPRASIVGKITPRHDFYSYEAKYLDNSGADFEIPADLPVAISKHIQELSVTAFKVLCCRGMARVDFFVTPNEILINEINTIPGFTEISMYPKLWQASGLEYTDLISELIELALVEV